MDAMEGTEGAPAFECFLAMEPPTVTHNDLEPCTRHGRPSIRKSDRLRDAEDAVIARLRACGVPRTPVSGPMRVSVRWCFPRGAKRQGEPHTAKPDMSNMLKTLEDCLQRAGVIADDAQICEEHLAKAWCDPAGIWVRVEPLG